MPRYLDLDLGTLDAETLRQQGRDFIQSQAPAGWVINPWLDWMLGAVARMAVLVLVLAGRVPWSIFKAFGTSVLRIPANAATTATGTATFTLISNPAGYTITAGTNLDVDGVAFETVADLTLTTSVLTGSVAIVAQAAGASGSGLTGVSVQVIYPSYDKVASVTLTGPTTGGADGELDDAYVDRLADEIPTLSPKAIVSADVASIARADIEVVRALAIDNLVPPSTTGVAGAVTIAVMAANGTNVSTTGKNRVKAAIETGRILAITAYVIDPTANAIDVAFTATASAGYVPATVAADAKQAIKDFLSPANWGVPRDGSSPDWIDEPKVIRNDLFGVLYNVRGIHHVSALTLAVHSGVQGTADITMTGPAAVPTTTLTDIAATVT